VDRRGGTRDLQAQTEWRKDGEHNFQPPCRRNIRCTGGGDWRNLPFDWRKVHGGKPVGGGGLRWGRSLKGEEGPNSRAGILKGCRQHRGGPQSEVTPVACHGTARGERFCRFRGASKAGKLGIPRKRSVTENALETRRNTEISILGVGRGEKKRNGGLTNGAKVRGT